MGPTAIRVALAFAALTLAAGPAWAGALHGHMFEPFGNPWGDNAVDANRMGAGGAGNQGGGVTWNAAPVGWFGFESLSPGTYSVGFSEKDQYPRQFVFGVPVGSGQTDILVGRNPEYLTGARMHFQSFHHEYAQSFVAWGECVTQVSQRFPTFQQVQVTIHEGGPEGPQIGPMRWMEGSYANDAHAAWSAGEVPTVPGQLYTVMFRGDSLISVQFADARNLNGLDFPGGQSYVDGQPFGLPLRTVIGMDTDGISTTLNTTRKTHTQANWVPQVCGQTFRATGTSVVGVNFLTGSNGPLEVAIFESPGPDGMGVNQIGPVKWVHAVAWNAISMATWSPGEAPVTPGNTYYARIRLVAGGAFTIYTTGDDEYANGAYVNGGVLYSADLSGTICCEKEPGSGSIPPVVFSDWRVLSRTSTTAAISWTTTTPAMARIDYGPGAPYNAFALDDTVSNTHEYLLTGLDPGTEYHVQVTAFASGWRHSRSKDFAFVTDPLPPNLASNPGFESKLGSKWTTWGTMARENQPADGTGGLGGVKARTGSYYIGGASNGLHARGGAWQRVTVDPSRPVGLRASLWTYQIEGNEGFDATAGYTVRGRVGIDPAGGTDPEAPTVLWAPWSSGQQWYDLVPDWLDNHPSIYTDLTKTVQPLGSTVTVFLHAGADQAIVWTIYGWDDVYVWQPYPPATPVGRLGDLALEPDGARIALSGLVVTASSAQVGANYVQAPDRSAGVRAEGPAVFAPGHLVSLEGTLGTKASGERYLYETLLLADAQGDPAAPLGARVAHLGMAPPGGAGLGNVGLLMRAWGRVGSVDSGSFTLDDGSAAGTTLKVILPPGASAPASEFAQVIGVVQLQGASVPGVPVLAPRTAADIEGY